MHPKWQFTLNADGVGMDGKLAFNLATRGLFLQEKLLHFNFIKHGKPCPSPPSRGNSSVMAPRSIIRSVYHVVLHCINTILYLLS